MKTMVVYDSVFGNTEKVAQAIARGLEAGGDVEILPVNRLSVDQLRGLNFLVVGSPTRGFRPTEDLAKFLNSLGNNDLQELKVAAFDTRIALETISSSVFRFIVDKGGYAANTIAKLLQAKGGKLVAPAEGFFVTGEQGPLKDGELERATEWARQLSQVTP
jgi:flavodoxin